MYRIKQPNCRKFYTECIINNFKETETCSDNKKSTEIKNPHPDPGDRIRHILIQIQLIELNISLFSECS